MLVTEGKQEPFSSLAVTNMLDARFRSFTRRNALGPLSATALSAEMCQAPGKEKKCAFDRDVTWRKMNKVLIFQYTVFKEGSIICFLPLTFKQVCIMTTECLIPHRKITLFACPSVCPSTQRLCPAVTPWGLEDVLISLQRKHFSQN